MLAHAFAGHVTGKTVEMDRSDNRFYDVLAILRDQPGYHAGQDVSCTSGGHARISGGVYPNRSVWLCDQRAMPLQHHDQFVFAGECASDVDAVPLHCDDCGSGETSHLAGMRRDHQAASFAIEFAGSAFEGVETIGVEDERSFAFHD